jgi:hypothetical protein
MIINRFNEANEYTLLERVKDTFTNLIDEHKGITIIKALVIQSRLIYQELSEIMTGKGIKEQTLSILLTTIFILQILGMKFY